MSDAQELSSAWDALAAAALVGTASGTMPVEAPAMLRTAWDAVARDSAEATLLARAALVSTVRRSGWRPGPAEAEVPPPCETDHRPALRPLARARLSMLLAGTIDAETTRLLDEWLTLAAEWQPVPELLPRLLAIGTNRPQFREKMLAHVGPRGRWVAAMMPGMAWATASPEPDWNAFETADRAVRPAMLRNLRDADPARALGLLAAGWENEDPAVKAELLPALETGLSDPDEPFLEACLDDRRKEVRRAAMLLLRKLPNSRFCLRMEVRVASWIRFENGGFDVIRLPESCDKAMQRDGIDPKPPPNVGEKAHWMSQVAASVPVSWWTRTSGLAPRELVRAAAAGEWKNVFVPGWGLSLLANRDVSWAKALLAQTSVKLPMPLRVELVKSLPIRDREVFLIAQLAASISIDGAFADAVTLALAHKPWDETMGRAVLEALPPSAGADFRLMQVFGELAHALPPELAELAISLLPASDSVLAQRTNTLENFVDVLRLRQAMHKELAP